MPLFAVLRRVTLPVKGRGTLLNRLLKTGVPVACACSGRGACGRCTVSVLEGAPALSPPDAHERDVLGKSGASADARLACRCRVVDAAALIRLTTGYW